MSNNRSVVTMASVNKNLIIINVILFAVFIALQIGITTVIGTKSVEIEEIRQQKDEIRLETEILKAEIDEYKSFAQVESIIEQNSLVTKPVTILENNNSNEIAQR